MKKLFKALEVNEKDTLVTASGKGIVTGAGFSGLALSALGLGLILVGNVLKDKVVKEEEQGE